MTDETYNLQLGLAQIDAIRATSKPKTRHRSDRAIVQVGVSDLLSDALDEVGTHTPDLSKG